MVFNYYKHLCKHHQRYGASFSYSGFFKRKTKKDEERDATKARGNMLILKSIDAVGKLTYANAVAIRDGKTKWGKCTRRWKPIRKTKTEMYEYLLEQNSKK